MDPENRFALDLEQIYNVHGPLVSTAPPLTPEPGNGTATVEQTGPPTPQSGQIINFGVVAEGIYRSSFPHPTNLEHLESLKLRTIITLVDEPYAPESLQFVEANHINHLRIPIVAHKAADRVNSLAEVARVMQVLMDPSQHPVLVHCNKGKHRTGCMIAAYRKLHPGIELDIITEYRHYAGPKCRDWDEHFIHKLSLPVLHDLLRVGPTSLAGAALAKQHLQITLEINRQREIALRRYPTPPESDFDEDDVRTDDGVRWRMDDGTEEGMNPS